MLTGVVLEDVMWWKMSLRFSSLEALVRFPWGLTAKLTSAPSNPPFFDLPSFAPKPSISSLSCHSFQTQVPANSSRAFLSNSVLSQQNKKKKKKREKIGLAPLGNLCFSVHLIPIPLKVVYSTILWVNGLSRNLAISLSQNLMSSKRKIP